MKNSRQPVAVEAGKERASSSLGSNARSLENVEDLLRRTRVDVAELKRTGAREGFFELVADDDGSHSVGSNIARPLSAGGAK